MPSLLPGFEYDIFISYRQKDNRYDGWVSEFVGNLRKELEATFKEDVSIYFDANPHDGLLETHQVDESLEGKLKCLIFVPILSQTYCDPNSFAWNGELLAFRDLAKADAFGLNVKLANGNVASRILPICIHQLEGKDKALFEKETGGVLRAIEFIYKEPGVNRSLRAKDDDVVRDSRQVFYRDNVNKVANAIKEILAGLKPKDDTTETPAKSQESGKLKSSILAEFRRRNVFPAALVYVTISLLMWRSATLLVDFLEGPESLANFVAILLLGFFPVAMSLAWLYERSPSGFVRYGTAASVNNPFSSYQSKPLTGNAFILLLLIAVICLNLFGYGRVSTHASPRPIRLSLMLEGDAGEVALSPDGTKVVYSLNKAQSPLYVRNLDESFSTVLVGTEDAINPVFSPDGTMICFQNEAGIYKTPLRNIQPVKIAEMPATRGILWTESDSLIISSDQGSKLSKVSVVGGQVVSIQLPCLNFSRPSLLRGTNFILGSDENFSLLAVSPHDVHKLILPNGGWHPVYIEPGILLYATQGKLMAAPFDNKTLQLKGPSVIVLDQLNTSGLGYNALFDVADNGTLIYSNATSNDKVQFVWVDEHGTVVDSLVLPPDYYGAFMLSPDRTKLAYGMNGPTSDIWIFDLKSKLTRKLTNEGMNLYPVWSPDGVWVTYSSLSNGKWDIYRQNLNSSEKREQLTSTGRIKRSGTWSPDGSLLTFYEEVSGQGNDLFLLSMDGKKVTSPWHNTPSGEFQPRFSPDGNYICYYSNESGTSETYIAPYPATGEKWKVSDGVDAIWSPDGRRLFSRIGNIGSFFSVNVTTGSTPTFDAPQHLFTGPYIDVFDRSFDISADGKRLLVLKSVNVNEHIQHFEVVINWVEDLKRIMKEQGKSPR